MNMVQRKAPVFPMCKVAEYSVSASSTRRRSLVRAQIKQVLDDSEKRRWWYVEAKTEIRKYLRLPLSTRRDLTAGANRLRDSAASEAKKSKQDSLLGSARAIEAFAPIADSVRSDKVIASAGQREGARIQRGNVQIVVAPDLLLLERGTERVVGAIKLHASQEFKLSGEALLNASSILYTYLGEHGDHPVKAHCKVVDLFAPACEAAPASLKRRMQAVEAACQEIEGWWDAMYDEIRLEMEAKHRRAE
ncbi:hypothetical protein [Gemmatimonas sp. UBA7669]|uniref:hypothetical protein n=1 Tax=Gemmatimonas sp. UBA7669 TaxID=1946568 RepID=UPI0025C18222|nr:hypothetical protein [Gemmatimonas sp. UBA7669]